jgi:hypothetical protein
MSESLSKQFPAFSLNMLLKTLILLAIRKTQTRVHHTRHLEIVVSVTLPAVTRKGLSIAQGSTCCLGSVDVILFGKLKLSHTKSILACGMNK